MDIAFAEKRILGRTVKRDVRKKVNNSTHPALIRFFDEISRVTNAPTTPHLWD